MAFSENSRVRYFIKENTGFVRDSGWDLVRYDGLGEGWEPADYVQASGFNAPGKRLTGTQIISESDMGEAPIKSRVQTVRTGTVAAE